MDLVINKKKPLFLDNFHARFCDTLREWLGGGGVVPTTYPEAEAVNLNLTLSLSDLLKFDGATLLKFCKTSL